MRRQLLIHTAVLACLPALACGQGKPVTGYTRQTRPETPEQKAARETLVARRKAGPMVILHGGAHYIAAGNTAESTWAAVTYGADGVEADIKKTADGVHVVMHGPGAENRRLIFGDINDLTYHELLAAPTLSGGPPGADQPPLTFEALLELVRHRGMLLMLDVKDPGVGEELIDAIDKADAWDHLVGTPMHSPRLTLNPKMNAPRFMGWDNPGIVDPSSEAVRRLLPEPGQLMVAEDPRILAAALGRTIEQMPLPADLFAEWEPTDAPETPTDNPNPYRNLAAWSRELSQTVDNSSREALLALLDTEAGDRRQVDLEGEQALARDKRIFARAWAALHLGVLGAEDEESLDRLEFQVRNRSFHHVYDFHAYDAAMAVRALGMLHATRSLPLLAEILTSNDPAIKAVFPEEWKAYYTWAGYEALLKSQAITALGVIGGDEAKDMLWRYINLSPEEAKECYAMIGHAGSVLANRFDLTPSEWIALIGHPTKAVRESAVLACLNDMTGEKREALRQAAPWAVAMHERLTGRAAPRAERRIPREPAVDATPADAEPLSLPADAPFPPALVLDCGKGITMELVLIPAGEFRMGTPPNEAKRWDNEGPQRMVRIEKPFYMGRFEVTRAQWKAVLGESKVRTNHDFDSTDDCPIEQTNWDECQAFCRALSERAGYLVRLPSEAEWEYACRAGTTGPFNLGASLNADQANMHGPYPYGRTTPGPLRGKTTPVGSFEPNAWGLYDMHGNVLEWCLDTWHDSYDGAPADGSAWATGGDTSRRVLRGGAWGSEAAWCRSGFRYKFAHDCTYYPFFGLRVVVPVSK